ncbi:MAG: pantoate--beta-alanine ligase [Rhodospirillales bacterium]|jgi:pantoate--beta-alanine ligase|nr:pantoate--beta-alanine ligase [Rhodospirillales bacterium]MDP6773544.1 pantoate--beta-alanine ligase [Rhodospirillales bacterium]
METVRTVPELRRRLDAWRAAGETIGLVPTMGALHEGHLSLVRLSLAKTRRTCASLFVNPKQFAPGEDYDVYPRDEAADASRFAAEGVDLLFAPAMDVMFPDDHVTTVAVPGLGDGLEGEFRPGFFTGVATAVAKLLLQALPDAAFFGEKDYQQLLVIRRMVRDLHIPVAIEAGPTVREADGLALSSRNAYLGAEQRATAPALHRTLLEVAERVAEGADAEEAAAWGRAALLDAGFTEVDYVEVRDAATLAPAGAAAANPLRVLGAAHLGTTRLIDNVAV